MEIIIGFLIYWKATGKHGNGQSRTWLLAADTDWRPF